ncbi:MAG TPA: MarR family transcriptional regulator [Acidimicrobiales bacterium]|nr:MarR family transcriptional regulator [Acidimicrobiales bacterium]HLN42303.1 MarR family transcriptional regulator [Acidimicrobiales bacterium]
MTGPRGWWDDWPTPALLRRARDVYRASIRKALDEAGCDDMPRNGAYVIGGMARTGTPLSELIKQMGVSKQAAGQLVDTLVTRGYLDRTVDPDDRRRLTITLTERGQSAAAVVKATVDRVDARLVARVGAQSFANAMATLASLIEGDGDARANDPGELPDNAR